MVRSKLEYASLIWSPYYWKYINSIEQVQRVFAKYLFFKLDGEYTLQGIEEQVILTRLNMMSLYGRRIIDMCIFLHNLINNKIKCPLLLGELNFLVPRLASGNSPYFYLSQPDTNIMYTTPIFKICSALQLHFSD